MWLQYKCSALEGIDNGDMRGWHLPADGSVAKRLLVGVALCYVMFLHLVTVVPFLFAAVV